LNYRGDIMSKLSLGYFFQKEPKAEGYVQTEIFLTMQSVLRDRIFPMAIFQAGFVIFASTF